MPRLRGAALIALVGATGFAHPATAGETLQAVQDRGFVRCGGGVLRKDRSPTLRYGLDHDVCRAVAAAVVGDAGQVELVPLSARDRFAALREGAVDVLLRSTTWTLTRDAVHGIDFTGVLYHDGQGFLARRAEGGSRLADFAGETVCAQQGTTTLGRLRAHNTAAGLDLDVRAFRSGRELLHAFFDGACTVISRDRGGLLGVLAAEAPDPEAYVLLEDTLSREPLAAAVREDDPEWADVVVWVRHALINAEALGITSANADRLAGEGNRAQRLFLGTEGDLGPALELDRAWARRIVTQVGNYGEIHRRNFGDRPRGPNALWTEGGRLYAPPMR